MFRLTGSLAPNAILTITPGAGECYIIGSEGVATDDPMTDLRICDASGNVTIGDTTGSPFYTPTFKTPSRLYLPVLADQPLYLKNLSGATKAYRIEGANPSAAAEGILSTVVNNILVFVLPVLSAG